MIGKTIAHYDIASKLGQGGMGEVWLAVDTKLNRQVALKVLPEDLAQDKERLARFEREARVLAQLNHTNIATVHGFDEHEGIHFLVMEYLESEDLSERLLRGALPIKESLLVAKQIAVALEAAHDKGIIHRDLKPANIKVGDDGGLKVLDFGLAKALSDDSEILARSGVGEDSPTITDIHTRPGAILGTAAYMSPEQAKGRSVDKRSDIWAFGCVLFECLTGASPFSGEDVADTLAAILRGEPNWALVPSELPQPIHYLLRKCLAKDRDQRLHEIADARVDLELAISNPSNDSIGGVESPPSPRVTARRFSIMTGIGIALVASVLTGLFVWKMKPVSDSAPSSEQTSSSLRRVRMELGDNQELHTAGGRVIKLSPDGLMLGFVGVVKNSSGEAQVFLRRLDQLDATPLVGAKTADQFCFSPDGQWVAFRDYEEGWIKKVKITGGRVTNLCPAKDSVGMDWGDDGTIVFGVETGGLRYIPETGGEPQILTQMDGRDITHRWPEFLPGGKEIVFVAHSAKGAFGVADLRLHRLSEGRSELIYDGGTAPRYLENGQLVFLAGDRLLSLAMDPQTLKVNGTPRPLEEGVEGYFGGAAGFEISANGDLIFVERRNREHTLDWVDRDGVKTEFLPKARYHSFSLSPDGKSAAYSLIGDRGVELWMSDLDRPSPIQLTHDGDVELFPIWSPDGSAIIYSVADRSSMPALGWLRADRVGGAHILIENETFLIPLSMHSNGRQLLVHREKEEGDNDLLLLNLSGDSKTGWTVKGNEEFLESGSRTSNGLFSPDGKWVVYASTESLRYRLFIRRSDNTGPTKVLSLSAFSSRGVAWSMNTNELLYVDRGEGQGLKERKVFVAKFRVVDESFVIGSPVPWPGSEFIETEGAVSFAYDVVGDRILLMKSSEENRTERTQVVWTKHALQLDSE